MSSEASNSSAILEFQSNFRLLSSENVEEIKEKILKSPLSKDEQGLRELAHEFVFLLSVTNIDTKNVANLLVLLNSQESENLQKLKVFVADEIINPSKDANNNGKAYAFRLLRQCYHSGLYNDTNIFEYVQRFPKTRKINCFLLFCFLAQEIQQKSPELFSRLKTTIESLKIADKTIQKYIDNFDSLPLIEFVEYGCEKNSPAYEIMYGDKSKVADETVLPYLPFASFSSQRIKTAKDLKEFLVPEKDKSREIPKDKKLTKDDFLESAKNDDVQTLLACIETGKFNIDSADATGMTALHYAASFGHIQIVKILVEKGARINKKNDWGETCLHYAAKYGSLCTVEFLVTKGGDIFAEDQSRWTPFIDSVDSGSLNVTVFLATKGSDMNRRSRDGKAPLHIAAINGDLPICEFLVLNGAAIDSKDDSQKTPLHFAASEGHLNICQFLCNNSADQDIRDLTGRAALHYAALFGHVDVIECLIDHGSNPNCVDNSGTTPLMLAASGGYLACVECLVFKGADINMVDSAKKTALDLATASQIRDYLGSLV